MTKSELRAIYKQKRKELAPAHKTKLDDLLLIKFQQMYFPGVTTLLSYWPSSVHPEPDTHLFSGFLRHTIPGIEIAYPVINEKTTTFEAVLAGRETSFLTNSYGIPEPKDGSIIEPGAIDLVFVPLLICDCKGYRVGYGKGFYDRYLAACREDVIKVGFNYFAPVDNIDDASSFDIPLNYLVTTDTIYEF